MNTEKTEEFLPPMKPSHKKTCCHCGRETHSQPQDYNHDTGYGHCYDCLKNPQWYVGSAYQYGPFRLDIYEHRDRNNGPLSSDDSHGKVFELSVNGRVREHFTGHSTKENIIKNINNIYSVRFSL